ncbi:hypothetical protein NLJ89_g1391 [Agrocybe chaxingu]|uniref:Tyrosinase copper-binding domain-containing protein n=1 Tax=Agrocybe chaxingu TaxID=84603 RepID=A0A9W8N063_9AGAR|nr:hypothetical protein NLJ89_g1391 [Agrocybe chaxingu]
MLLTSVASRFIKANLIVLGVVWATLVPNFSNAAPHASCTNPIIRKEWRNMDRATQKSYTDAINCLLKRPGVYPKTVAPGAVNRYDDYVAIHIQSVYTAHGVGHFLAWHRYYIHHYENALRTECGYTGAQPYWDWTLDAPLGKYAESPIWDATYGFGGNGPYVEVPRGTFGMVVSPTDRSGGGCVPDGPLKDMIVNLGPGNSLNPNPRCLARDWSPNFAAQNSNWNITKQVLEQKDFGRFTSILESGTGAFMSGGNIHAGGHYSVGGYLGQMGDFWVSPGDPVFFLHHTNLDRVWRSWQAKDLANRLNDISGPLNYMDWQNVRGGNTTLDYEFNLGPLSDDVAVRDLMDVKGGFLCYDYDELYPV